MSQEKSSFRQIFKATSIFGGVQVFNIIISLVRGKLVAVLIGTAGMGLNGLLTSGINLIKIISGLGLEQSAVKDISNANGTNDKERISRTYSVFRKWVWVTGILGVVITISLASVLSQFSFGDDSHTWSFIWISSTFIFGALTGGVYTLLRGLRKIGDLAKANIFGSVVGLIVTIPIYYFWGIDGVVPAIIVASVIGYFVSLYFKRKVKIQIIDLAWKEVFTEGKGMVMLGVSLSLSAMFSTAVNYVFNAYIARVGTLSDLGLYNAGMTIMNGYVGMVFTAISTDYFPRLSEKIDDGKYWHKIVNQQGELLVLILGPILAFMLASAPILVEILLSKEFLGTVDFILFASVAIPIKGLVWVYGFVIMAKGDNKLFFITELIASSVFLFLNMLFFKSWGIPGLGVSMIIGFAFSLIMMLIIMHWRYSFKISKQLLILNSVCIILLGTSVFCAFYLDYPKAYFSGFGIFIIASILSLIELNKRIDIASVLKSLIKKK